MNKQIEELKKRIDENVLSFVIGAGFSKNVSKVFLDWKGLLKDMIIEMYDIKPYLNSDMQKIHIENIISKVGYLEIASEYIRRKGYREAIDVYIEQRTPYLEQDDEGKYLVKCNGYVIDESPSLAVHKKLIGVGVNNIYTFNYDNLLEVVADTDIVKGIENKKAIIERDIKDINHYKDKFKYLCSKIEHKIDSIDSSKSIIEIIKEFSTSDKKDWDDIVAYLKPNLLRILEDVSENLGQADILFYFNREKIQKDLDSRISRYNYELNDLEDTLCGKYHLVDNSWRISLSKKYKNIFKLHGNLRIKDMKYGFDGDIHCHYIIAKEDYERYCEKHEAFVNLMRISLLTESFCLIGFSGDDPNFLNWLSWVRDILERKDNPSSVSNKLFFIAVAKTEDDLSPEKVLLFRNHNIEYINLNHIYGDNDPDVNLIKLFDDLSVKDSRQYEDALRELNLELVDDKSFSDFNVKINKVGIDKLWDLLLYNRFPELGIMQSHYRESILSKTQRLVKGKKVDEFVAKAIYAAIIGEKIPIDAIIPFTKEKSHVTYDELKFQIECFSEIYPKFCMLELRSKVLLNLIIEIVEEPNDEQSYNYILYKAFNLDFHEMRSLINQWNPEEHRWSIIKLGLNTLFERDPDISNTIKTFENKADYNCNQEYIYNLEILNSLENANGIHHFDPPKLRVIKRLKQKNDNLNRISDNLKYLISELKADEKLNIEPYGSSKKIIQFDERDSDLIVSLQLLQTLIEIGTPLYVRHTILFDKNEWYKVFVNLYESYPYPCLYYSLHYWDEKDFLNRIAQDLIYSNKLKEIQEDILNKLFAAYDMIETPEDMRESILVVLSKYFMCFDETVWSERFMRVFRSTDIWDNEDSGRRPFKYDFFVIGFKLIHNRNYINEVLKRCIEGFDRIDSYGNKLIISACFHKKDYLLNSELLEMIKNSIPKDKYTIQYHVLLNLYRLLNQELKELLSNRFYLLSDQELKDQLLLENVNSIIRKNNDFEAKVKSIILNSNKLWATGKETENNKQWYGFPINRIDINKIQKSLVFAAEELKNIYQKMIVSLIDVEEYIIQHREYRNPLNDLVNWSDLLVEMKLFLYRNKNVLELEPDYREIEERVDEAYFIEAGAKTIFEALISDDADIISLGLNRLYNEVNEFGAEKYKIEYIIVANKIISIKVQKLNLYIEHFGWAITNQTDSFDVGVFKQLIELILNSFEPYYANDDFRWSSEAKKEKVEKELLKLNKVLTDWGIEHKYWNSHKKRFYT